MTELTRRLKTVTEMELRRVARDKTEEFRQSAQRSNEEWAIKYEQKVLEAESKARSLQEKLFGRTG